MRTITAVLSLALAASLAAAQEKKDEPPKVGVLVVRASGLEVGAELAKDPKAAGVKYTPKEAPKGVLGGTMIQLHGVIGFVDRMGQIRLASGTDWEILLKGKVEGSGPYVEVGVTGATVYTREKLFVVEGTIRRTDKNPEEKKSADRIPVRRSQPYPGPTPGGASSGGGSSSSTELPGSQERRIRVEEVGTRRSSSQFRRRRK